MKRRIYFILVFFLGAVSSVGLSVSGMFFWSIGNQVASQVTAESLQAVKPGMSREQLRQLLGEPYHVSGKQVLEREPESLLAHYSKPGWIDDGYEVTVELGPSAVLGVSVEYSDLLIYRCDSQTCPQYLWRRDLLDALGKRR